MDASSLLACAGAASRRRIPRAIPSPSPISSPSGCAPSAAKYDAAGAGRTSRYALKHHRRALGQGRAAHHAACRSIDTVPIAPDRSRQNGALSPTPATSAMARSIGKGSIDDKGVLASMMQGDDRTRRSRKRWPARCILVAAAEEEVGGQLAYQVAGRCGPPARLRLHHKVGEQTGNRVAIGA